MCCPSGQLAQGVVDGSYLTTFADMPIGRTSCSDLNDLVWIKNGLYRELLGPLESCTKVDLCEHSVCTFAHADLTSSTICCPFGRGGLDLMNFVT